MNLTLKPDFFAKPSSVDLAIKEILYPQKVIIGVGALSTLLAQVQSFGTRVFIVTHAPGRFTSSGVLSELLKDLVTAGITTDVFEITGTPTIDDIDRGVSRIKSQTIDLVLCIGGGTVLDAGKAMAMVATNDGSCEQYQLGERTPRNKALPILAIPTTAGSGSEATTVAVIENPRLGVIKSLNHPFMMPSVVILDPIFLNAISASVAATSGLDAFSHALESFTSPKASALTRSLSLAAMKLIYDSLPKVVNRHAIDDDYINLLTGSHLAGQALNAGVGAAHIYAQPITAAIGVSHGLALSFVFEEVIRFNEERVPDIYQTITELLLSKPTSGEPKMSKIVKDFMVSIGIIQKPEDFAKREAIEFIMEKIVRSTSHIWTNACPVNLKELEEILNLSWTKNA